MFDMTRLGSKPTKPKPFSSSFSLDLKTCWKEWILVKDKWDQAKGDREEMRIGTWTPDAESQSLTVDGQKHVTRQASASVMSKIQSSPALPKRRLEGRKTSQSISWREPEYYVRFWERDRRVEEKKESVFRERERMRKERRKENHRGLWGHIYVCGIRWTLCPVHILSAPSQRKPVTRFKALVNGGP